jgi:hypothetical protein
MNNIDDFYAWTKKHKTEDIECFMPKCSFAILPEFYQGNSVPSIYIKEASEQHDRGWHLVLPKILEQHLVRELCQLFLYPGVLESGDPFVLPVSMYANQTESSWQQAWINEIIPDAQKGFVKTTLGKDRFFHKKVPTGNKPIWPTMKLEDWLFQPFRDRVIRSPDEIASRIQRRQKLEYPPGFEE